MDSDDDMVC